MGSRFSRGDRVRVAKPEYRTFDRVGTVTEPDEFWTFGPCVILDGDEHAGAYLDDDLELIADDAFGTDTSLAWQPEPAPYLARSPEPEPDLRTGSEAAEPGPPWRLEPEAARPLAAPAVEPPASPALQPVQDAPAASVPEPAASEAARERAPPAVPAETAEQRAQREWELYQRGLKDGWGEAVRHVAYRARVEGGALADSGAVAPELNGLIAGILARIEIAEARALMAEANLARREERALVPCAPEPERPAFSTQTLTTLIQAVSEIVIQERERARVQWQAKLDTAQARAEAERARRMATESELSDLRRRAEPQPLPPILQEEALVEVLSCAEEYISGGRLNRALVLHALRETLSHIRQANAFDALRLAAQPRRALGERR